MVKVAGLPWAQCQGAGDYPVVYVDFDASVNGTQVRVFFDTGARHNYISEELLVAMGVPISARHFRVHERNIGRATTGIRQRTALQSAYREQVLDVTISDGAHSYSGTARFRIVRNWSDSTFASTCRFGECDGSSKISTPNQSVIAFDCAFRVGLMSAGLVKDLQVSAVVDGTRQILSLTKAVYVEQ